MEIPDGSVELAKQVLCQLSYTPIEIGPLGYRNFLMLRDLILNCN
jgi:hypothetical protein